jgi:hypothetical protein
MARRADEADGRFLAGARVALAVILLWYAGIGALAVAGSIALSRRLLSARAEQTVFGALLVPIACMYLAFNAYFDADGTWGRESVAAVLFAVSGLLGMRVPALLVLGYALHGGWDLLHEIQAHASLHVEGTRRFSAIPLAYGAFCATYDWGMAGYFYLRRAAWSAAWRARAG